MVSDNFNRANGGLGPNWTDQQSIQNVFNNTATSGDAFTYASSYWTANSFNNNHSSQIVIVASTTYVAPGVRMSSTGATSNWYAFFSHNSMQKMVAGTVTTLGSTALTPVAGDTIKLDITGTTLTPAVNGTNTTTFTDTSLSSGNAGINFFANVATLDDWAATGEVANVAAAPGNTTQFLMLLGLGT